jgi:hypothetical protein
MRGATMTCGNRLEGQLPRHTLSWEVIKRQLQLAD